MAEPTTAWDAEQIAWMRRAASGKISVQQACAGPETGFSPRYFPRIASQNVRPTGMPEDGYLTGLEARIGAQQYREACRAELAKVAQ